MVIGWALAGLLALGAVGLKPAVPDNVGNAWPESAVPAYDRTVGMAVQATAYTRGPESTGKQPGHPAYGLTATGTQAREGLTIAVDPREIPLGSLVYIAELDQFRVAEDTGGAIRGKRIDLFMEKVEDARRWGIRTVRVRVFPKV